MKGGNLLRDKRQDADFKEVAPCGVVEVRLHPHSPDRSLG